ncbi:MAG: hypothetical protein GXP62_04055 [Oligoflexia bacterium]|nr:hypothetical protein [Oligoflexia bacterium]
MRVVPDGVKAAVKRIDRHLEFLWNNEIQRWELVRFIPNAFGKYVWVMTIENPDGTYRDPDMRIVEYLRTYDLSRFRGNNHEERMMSFLRWKRAHNEEVRERARRAGVGDRFARFRDWVDAARRLGVDGRNPKDVERLRKHMAKDTQRMAERDLTRAQKKRILLGMDE